MKDGFALGIGAVVFAIESVLWGDLGYVAVIVALFATSGCAAGRGRPAPYRHRDRGGRDARPRVRAPHGEARLTEPTIECGPWPNPTMIS